MGAFRPPFAMARRKNADCGSGASQQASAELPEERELANSGAALLSSGLALLNLCCSHTTKGAFGSGKIVNLVGDSSSGKTFLALSALAEASNDPKFDSYALVYDDVERACEFNIEALFGKKLQQRMQPPRSDSEGNPEHSTTVQDFSDNLTDFLDSGRNVIYVLDSLDAVTTRVEQAEEASAKAARRSGKSESGTYGTDKAKYISRMLRLIEGRLKSTSSIVIIVSQVRENLDAMSHQRYVRAGGKALQFYCAHVLWLLHKGKIARTVRGIKHHIGDRVAIDVTKNKLVGKRHSADFALYYEYGWDDISSCIDFLGQSGAWKCEMRKAARDGESAGVSSIQENTLGLPAGVSKEKAIRLIEDGELHTRLRREVYMVWHDIERQLSANRKPKYA